MFPLEIWLTIVGYVGDACLEIMNTGHLCRMAIDTYHDPTPNIRLIHGPVAARSILPRIDIQKVDPVQICIWVYLGCSKWVMDWWRENKHHLKCRARRALIHNGFPHWNQFPENLRLDI